MKSFFTFFPLLLCLFLTPRNVSAQCTGNLVTGNAGFENATLAPNWISGGAISMDANTGTQSLQLAASSYVASSSDGINPHNYPTMAGKVYSLSFYAKSSVNGTPQELYVTARNSGGTSVASLSENLTLTTSYALYTYHFVIPANGVTFDFGFSNQIGNINHMTMYA